MSSKSKSHRSPSNTKTKKSRPNFRTTFSDSSLEKMQSIVTQMGKKMIELTPNQKKKVEEENKKNEEKEKIRLQKIQKDVNLAKGMSRKKTLLGRTIGTLKKTFLRTHLGGKK